jgi:hypothetical protein
VKVERPLPQEELPLPKEELPLSRVERPLPAPGPAPVQPGGGSHTGLVQLPGPRDEPQLAGIDGGVDIMRKPE